MVTCKNGRLGAVIDGTFVPVHKLLERLAWEADPQELRSYLCRHRVFRDPVPWFYTAAVENSDAVRVVEDALRLLKIF